MQDPELTREVAQTGRSEFIEASLPRRETPLLLGFVMERGYREAFSPLLLSVPVRAASSRLGWPVERLFLPMTCPGNSAATLNSRLRRSPSTSGAGRKSWIWVAATKRLAFLQVAMSRGRDAPQRYLPSVDDWQPCR